MLAVAVLGSLLAWPQPGQAAGFSVRNQATLLPGVEVRGLRDASLSVDVGRVAKGAGVRIEAVAAAAVAGGVETTSGVCRRVGGILCVNADFASCASCTTAFGGIIRRGVLHRSPVSNHPQLSLGPAGPAAGQLGLSATLEATVTYVDRPPPGLIPSPPKTRVEQVPPLALNAVNRTRGANQVVLYTPAWAPDTRTRGGGEEALLGGLARIGASPVTTRSLLGNGGSKAIPSDGMVLSADGTGRDRMSAFWAKAADPKAVSRSVVLRLTPSRPVEESVGGHPVIMTNGQTVIGGSTDPFATNRHPRTLVGWNGAGDIILATVDGRQPGHSAGVSLVQAADVLRQLGATNGFNLDGGGSSTFVSLAPGGSRTPQVLNRPSDGSERRVTTVLAVIPVNPSSVRVRGAGEAPPQPAPAPPGPPPADEASASGLAASVARTPAPAPTTIAPPTTEAPVITDPPPEVAPDPSTLADIELSAPTPVAVAPIRPRRPATGVPATIAALALLAAAAATFRTSRQGKRLKVAPAPGDPSSPPTVATASVPRPPILVVPPPEG